MTTIYLSQNKLRPICLMLYKKETIMLHEDERS